MTPGAIIGIVLALARPAVSGLAAGVPRTVLLGIVTALDEVPALVDALIEDGWDEDAVKALRHTLTAGLGNVPYVSAQQSRRLAGGVVALVDIIVSLSADRPSVLRERARDRARKLRAEAVASRLPEVGR